MFPPQNTKRLHLSFQHISTVAVCALCNENILGCKLLQIIARSRLFQPDRRRDFRTGSRRVIGQIFDDRALRVYVYRRFFIADFYRRFFIADFFFFIERRKNQCSPFRLK